MTPEQWADASTLMVARLTTELRGSFWDRQGRQWVAVQGWLMVVATESDAAIAASVRAILTAVADPANDLGEGDHGA